MKRVPIHELKRNLSALVAEAKAGKTLLITRHKHIVARLVPPQAHVHVGKRAGNANLKPAIKRSTNGRYLEMLKDDRRGGAEDN